MWIKKELILDSYKLGKWNHVHVQNLIWGDVHVHITTPPKHYLLYVYGHSKTKCPRRDGIKYELQFDIAHWRTPPKTLWELSWNFFYYDTVKIGRLSLSKIMSERLLDSRVSSSQIFTQPFRRSSAPSWISHFMRIASFLADLRFWINLQSSSRLAEFRKKWCSTSWIAL